MEWKKLENQIDVEKLMDKLNNFHDSCIKSLSYTSGTYVDEDLSMIMDTNPVINLLIQRQSEALTSIEFCLEGVKKFHINNDLNLTLEIYKAVFFKKDEDFYWYSSEDMTDETTTSFVCKKIKWREV